MAKKLVEEQQKAVEEAEKSAEEGGTGNPVLQPDQSKMPEPGTTPDTEGILNTDQAKALSPNITVSGTKPDGEGGQVLLDTVDPAVANAALVGPKPHKPPENPSLPPEDTTRIPGEGEVLFEVTADNQPFWQGNGIGQGGPLQKGQKVVMSKEEAELLTKSKAGHVVSSPSASSASSEPPPPKPSAKNAKIEGNDAG